MKQIITRFDVRISAAKPKGNFGTYAKIAIMEMDLDAPAPKMISTRAKGCRRIVMEWERSNVGGEKSAFARNLREAQRIAQNLNEQMMVRAASLSPDSDTVVAADAYLEKNL